MIKRVNMTQFAKKYMGVCLDTFKKRYLKLAPPPLETSGTRKEWDEGVVIDFVQRYKDGEFQQVA